MKYNADTPAEMQGWVGVYELHVLEVFIKNILAERYSDSNLNPIDNKNVLALGSVIQTGPTTTKSGLREQLSIIGWPTVFVRVRHTDRQTDRAGRENERGGLRCYGESGTT